MEVGKKLREFLDAVVALSLLDCCPAGREGHCGGTASSHPARHSRHCVAVDTVGKTGTVVAAKGQAVQQAKKKTMSQKVSSGFFFSLFLFFFEVIK